MGNGNPQLQVLFFPFMAHGHMIPTLDLAKLFAVRGAKSTILTTSLNTRFFDKPIETFKNRYPDADIGIKILDFPCEELGLPEGCENTDFIISNYKADSGMMITQKFLLSTKFLKQQLEQLLETIRPDCLVADIFFPWATEAANKFQVPRLVFHGTCYFSICASACISMHKPQKKVPSSSDPFLIPDLPGSIYMTSEQLMDNDGDTDIGKFMEEAMGSAEKCFGVLMNSFYELEPAYADFYQNVMKLKSWHVGPLSLCNVGMEEKAGRGPTTSIDELGCLKWFDSKKPNSVIYLCFGSMTNFTNEQLVEIASGLEGSQQDFIWVVRKDESKGEKEEWLPEGFEERTRGKGLVIRGWAPQVLILDHQAIGGFLTHCGWNSILEGVAAGLPMVTWPVGAEQFYNEKLVIHVLKIGVSVGATKKTRVVGDFVRREKVEEAVREVMMVGEEAEGRRRRVKELAVMAKAAVAEGGSSYNSLSRFVQEMKSLVQTTKDEEREEQHRATSL